MPEYDIFDALVELHCEKNLARCKKHIHKGRITTDDAPNGYEPGVDENEKYTGLLLIANGATLMDELQREGVVRMHGHYSPISTIDDFINHLSAEHDENGRKRNKDGAYLVNTVSMQITRVPEYMINPKQIAHTMTSGLAPYLSDDFFHVDSSVPVDEEHIGTKTAVAIRMPQAFPNARAYQIKRTSDSPLGMGSVTKFGPQGIEKKFSLVYDPHGEGPFIDEKNRIAGILRTYSSIDGRIVCTGETRVDPASFCTRQPSIGRAENSLAGQNSVYSDSHPAASRVYAPARSV